MAASILQWTPPSFVQTVHLRTGATQVDLAPGHSDLESARWKQSQSSHPDHCNMNPSLLFIVSILQTVNGLCPQSAPAHMLNTAHVIQKQSLWKNHGQTEESKLLLGTGGYRHGAQESLDQKAGATSRYSNRCSELRFGKSHCSIGQGREMSMWVPEDEKRRKILSRTDNAFVPRKQVSLSPSKK
jgi:hypothetical protein